MVSDQIQDELTRRRLAGFMTNVPNPFRWFDSSPEVIRLVVMMYVGTVSENFTGG